MSHVVVKIDACNSKLFTQGRELEEPSIRKLLAEKLKELSSPHFPYSDMKFPKGSFYKIEGDAVYFILEKQR